MAQRARDAQLLFLVQRQAQVRQQIAATVTAQVLAIVRALLAGRWYDPAAQAKATPELARVVRLGQVQTANVTGAYLDAVLRDLGASPARGTVTLPADLRGIPAEVEWERPAKTYRSGIKLLGLDDLEAAQRAENRATQLAADDLDAAMRSAARQRLASVDKVTGFRRVIHPEASRGGTCGLCIAAAHRTYHRSDLLPVHGGCKCEVFPIVSGKADPSPTWNERDISALYREVLKASGSTAAADLRKARVSVAQHGELGPVLVDDGHRFRSQEQAAGDIRNTSEAAIVADDQAPAA